MTDTTMRFSPRKKKSIRVDGLMVFMEFGHSKSISDHYNTTRKPLGTIRIPSEIIRIPLETITAVQRQKAICAIFIEKWFFMSNERALKAAFGGGHIVIRRGQNFPEFPKNIFVKGVC